MVADLLAPFLASLALSADFAIEVAAQSREIDEQRRFTGLIIDSLPLGLYVVDRDYRIQIWNRQREIGAPGLRRDEVVGRQVFEVLTRQPAEELRAEFDRVFQTGEIQQAELEVTLGGEVRSFRLTKIPMRLEGDEISHVITIGEDVTDSRRIQGQIMQSEKLAAIGQLAAGVMHEINNPLATISACVAAITGRLDDASGTERAAVEEYLELIDKEVDRCTRIVDGLLDFSRPKGKAKGRVVLNALVDETLFLLKHHQRFKRLTVARELDLSLPATIGNAEQLTQVLMALMLNAVDAMDDRGKLTVRTGRRPSLRRTRWCWRSRTTASAFRGRISPRSSSRSTPPSRPAAAPGWDSRSATASSRIIRAGSRWTASRAAAPSSGSFCRCSHEDSGGRGRSHRRPVRQAGPRGAALSRRSGGRRHGRAAAGLRREGTT